MESGYNTNTKFSLAPSSLGDVSCDRTDMKDDLAPSSPGDESGDITKTLVSFAPSSHGNESGDIANTQVNVAPSSLGDESGYNTNTNVSSTASPLGDESGYNTHTNVNLAPSSLDDESGDITNTQVGLAPSSLGDESGDIANTQVSLAKSSLGDESGYNTNTNVSLATSSPSDESGYNTNTNLSSTNMSGSSTSLELDNGVSTIANFIGEHLATNDRERTKTVDDFFSSDGLWKDGVSRTTSTASNSSTTSSSTARRLLQLHSEEANCKDRKMSLFAAEFKDLFVRLPSDAVPHIRATLDACLVFRPDGRSADLRSMVFEEISRDQQMLVLDKINASCCRPPPGTRGFVVLSDVDDTLFPASDVLHIGGSDRSWHLDGRFYPGVSRLHRELRAGLRENYGGDYSVLLTARPPFLVKSTTTKAKRLSGLTNPRLAILPGSSGTKQVASNFFKILAGNFSQLGQVKLQRMQEYSALFPEYAGRFVFIGDDGQGDFDAAVDMLSLKDSRSPSRDRTPQPLLAFVAVHAVQQKQGTTISPEARAQRIAAVRKKNPPIAVEQSAIPGPAGATRHRFFYFDDYMDLSEQLTTSGWLDPEQGDAVMQAFIVDNTPEPLQEALGCNYLALRAALRSRRASLREADEVEKEAFLKAEALLPAIEQAHVRLGPPPPECSSLAFEIQLDTLAAHNVWDLRGPDRPTCIFQNINDKSFSRWQWEADYKGFINLPWPCEALCHTAARGAIDIGSSCRCFVVLDGESDNVLRNGDSVEVLLVSQNDPNAEKPVGRITIKIFWVGVVQAHMTVEDFCPESESSEAEVPK